MLLLTGASGYLGRQLADLLSRKGYELKLLSRNRIKTKKADVFIGDITKPGTLKGLGKDVDTVIHLAGLISYTHSLKTLMLVNHEGTRNVLDACGDCERIIFSSSVAVYASLDDRHPIDERYPAKPDDFYGMSKLAAEREVANFGVADTILRIAPVYGIGAPFMIKIIELLRKRQPVPNIDRYTHLVGVHNVLQAIDLVLKKKATGIYNVADQNPIKFLELARTFAKCLNTNLRTMNPWVLGFLSLLSGNSGLYDAFVKKRNYDISKAKKDLGFKPKENVLGEIKKIVNAYRKDSTLREGYQ